MIDACIGSSPLTRGKLVVALLVQVLDGLIPAHAGKTRSFVRKADASAAHPRSRGENTDPDKQITPETGSSPLTRGKPTRAARNWVQSRLIPAHAGKT